MTKIILKKTAPPKDEEPLSKEEFNKQKRLKALADSRIEKKRLEEETGIKVGKKNPYERWEEQKTSLRRSVSAKCWDCCGGEYYRNRIRFCDIFDCPLWNVRPYAKGITQDQCTAWSEVYGSSDSAEEEVDVDEPEEEVDVDEPEEDDEQETVVVPKKKIILKKVVKAV